MFSQDFFNNPYPTYQFLREHQPAVFVEAIGAWVVSRYEDVAFVLKDRRFSSVAPLVTGAVSRETVPHLYLIQDNILTQLDPPSHTRLRGLVHKAFTPRTIERLRQDIYNIANRLLDDAEKQGGLEIKEHFSYPLPLQVILEMIGVPLEDRNRVKEWNIDIALTLNPLATEAERVIADTAEAAQIAYLKTLIDQRRRQPQDDLLTALVEAEEQGDKLTLDEVIATCALLIFAGHETTTNLISNGLLALFRNPDQMKLLQENPALLRTGVEEMLRYDSPVQMLLRTATEDVEIAGQLIPAGQQLIPLMGAANYDPAIFANPYQLDIARQENPHLSLGVGIHYCMGAPLARMEASIAFELLLKRFPKMKLITQSPQYLPSLTLRQVQALEVEF